MLLLQSDLLAEAKTTFLKIGTCPLHIDIQFFFKLSATCRADYKAWLR